MSLLEKNICLPKTCCDGTCMKVSAVSTDCWEGAYDCNFITSQIILKCHEISLRDTYFSFYLKVYVQKIYLIR